MRRSHQLPGVVYLHGGVADARAALARGTVDWAQAFAVVLEKWGILSVSSVAIDHPSVPDVLAEASAVIASRAAGVADNGELLASVIREGRPALVEGPLTPELAELAGISVTAKLGPAEVAVYS